MFNHCLIKQGTRFGINGNNMDFAEKYKDYTHTFLAHEPDNNRETDDDTVPTQNAPTQMHNGLSP